jgi:outer membrane cobalamin receptor
MLHWRPHPQAAGFEAAAGYGRKEVDVTFAGLRRLTETALMAALVLGALRAEAAERMIVQIDTVEVTATPIMAEEEIEPYGGTITSVGRRQIEDLNAQDLPSALRLLPGVTISRYNLLGSYGGGEGGSVYVRGQGAGRPGSEIKVYVDGAPREVGVWSHPVMDIVPTDYAMSIDVYKGPQPYNYPGTFGTVDVASARRVEPGHEAYCDLEFGEYDTHGAVFRQGGKIQVFDYYLGATYKESDGHRPHADGRIESQYLRLGFDASSSIHLGYILQRTDNWSRDPGARGYPTPERDRFATQTLTHNIRLDHNMAGAHGFALLYYEDGRIRWEKDHLSGPDSPAGNSDTDWKNYGFRASEDIGRGDFALTAGLEIESEGGEFRNTTVWGTVPFEYGGRFRTVAPGLAARYSISVGPGRLVPSIGLRYYEHSKFSAETAPHAGLVYEARGWTASATYARGVSYPGVYTVGVAASTLEDLRAEVLDHAEAGINAVLGGGMKTQAAVFQDRAENLIQYTPDGLVNVRHYRVNGLEFSTVLAPRPDLSVYGAVTLLKAAYEKTPRVPAVSASVGANYKALPRLRLVLDAEYVDEQYAFNGRSSAVEIAEIERLPGYFVANAGVAYDVSGLLPWRGEVFLAVDNVTGEDYAFQPGYPMPGRTASLALRMGSF